MRLACIYYQHIQYSRPVGEGQGKGTRGTPGGTRTPAPGSGGQRSIRLSYGRIGITHLIIAHPKPGIKGKILVIATSRASPARWLKHKYKYKFAQHPPRPPGKRQEPLMALEGH
jgi:hypothetical protein